ncbi:pentapeptide repeat-containing protein [Intestinibacter sp.]|uniref:pentapeptide repeat-containing protein n=1 Tax=Intestinibacter sp. TaxID=1965304 RepID=UPI003F16968F
MKLRINKIDNENISNLKIDCENCFGLCCVALFFSKSDGFPQDKIAGKPCINLQPDFKCSVHKNLRKKRLKGCMSYDCFGAGQKVAQVTFKGHDWTKSPDIANKMFDAFLIIRQLHEMLWYLMDASTFISNDNIKNELNSVIAETEKLTRLDQQSIINIDIDKHRIKVNRILKQVNEFVKKKVSDEKIKNSKNKKALKEGYDFIGRDLTNTNLIGANFAGALLIASNMKDTNLKGANLIGADLRDADIRGANLEDSMFLTQSQVNTARGNSRTKLPKSLSMPYYWEK